MKIYNTLTRKEEEFVPLKKGEVGIYVCGPTVYDYPHIGHARTYIAFDAFVRYLRKKGYRVKYVMNITNVDDKIINRAAESGEDPQQLADRFERIFFEDMDELGLPRADAHPRVTDHIEDIIETIKRIIDSGYAYVADGDVYFSVRKVEDYGRLSKQSLDELLAGARVEPSEKKRDPMDFALWKAAKPDEPAWDSPWGRGRPGWHIECSTMSSKYLGEQFDVHGGAIDLIFPHHENEILQSEAASGRRPFVKYWLHTGFLNVGGEKMSKSLSNFITIRDLLERYDAASFRFFALLAHYRSPIDFTYEGLEKAKSGFERLYNTLEYARSLKRSRAGEALVRKSRKEFYLALDDDFNTPRAIAVLFDLAKEINKMSSASQKVLEFFEEALDVLGLKAERAQLSVDATKKIVEILKELGRKVVSEKGEELLADVIRTREELRAKGDYAASDRIRSRLEEMGIVLEDTKKGTTWKVKR